MRVDISALVDAMVAGNSNQIMAAALPLLQRGAPAAELAGRIGLIAAHADSDGHAILTLDAVGVLSRWLLALPQPEHAKGHERELPLLVQALAAIAPVVQAAQKVQDTYPEPLFPSQLPEGKLVNDEMHEAVYSNDAALVERLLFGLYGTGADYRTMEVRAYDGISTTFQNGGYPLILAVRGFQMLDAIEWGDRAPHILHWLAPHLPLHSEEPAWIEAVRTFNADSAHSMASLRTRLSAPKEENALPLRSLILSDADTTQVCQGVYNALMQGGASPRGVGSVIALAATDLLQKVDDGDRDMFLRASQGLLFSAAVRLVFARVQDVEVLPLLLTSAAFVHALHKALAQQSPITPSRATPAMALGGGLIAPALLETLRTQLDAQDLAGTISTTRRYFQLGYDARALFASIGLVAAQADAAADQGQTLQIVQAAGEEYMAWPKTLTTIPIDGILQVALRAAAFARRNTLVASL